MGNSMMEESYTMPKTNINDLVSTGFRAEVSWRGEIPGEYDGHVQVATVNTASPLNLPATENSNTEHFEGWFVTLDREGCNRMIRALRNARDKAYGVDA